MIMRIRGTLKATFIAIKWPLTGTDTISFIPVTLFISIELNEQYLYAGYIIQRNNNNSYRALLDDLLLIF